MNKLPSQRRERMLREELIAVRGIMAAVAESETRAVNPKAIPLSLGVFAAGIVSLIDGGLERVATPRRAEKAMNETETDAPKVEECQPLSHSWELWTQDMRQWPAYVELHCALCGKPQWYIVSNAPAGWPEAPR